MTMQAKNPSVEENRFQLVNSVAKKAKVIISHDMSAQISHNKAIRAAMDQKDDPLAPQQPQTHA